MKYYCVIHANGDLRTSGEFHNPSGKQHGKKTEVLESDRSISKSCLCHSLTGSKSYAGHVASDKLQKPTEPQLALLQDEEEAGAAS